MPSNNISYGNSAYGSSDAMDFEKNGSYDILALSFGLYHKDPVNVFLHLLTTPLGLVGFFSLIRYMANSSSASVALSGIYLLSLLPVVPNGVFAGTMLLIVLIVLLCRELKLGVRASLACIVAGYCLQDLAHLATGEKTFQGSYSNGGHAVASAQWLQTLATHTFYLLPLCIHITMDVAMPLLVLPAELKLLLVSPLPDQMQQLHAFAWLLTPLIVFALGSYCLDSKNSFCFFPGTPYFHRVLHCNLVTGGEDCRQEDLRSVRDWTMSQFPAGNKSSHWWYGELAAAQKAAFYRCATASQIFASFRELFSERNYCMDIIEGMNEIYVTGPSRSDEGNNSDQVFYTRHVDGPWGLIPFVSVYRCIVGMDRNMMITTHFPLANMSVNACEGDVLAFDFNREVHYITSDESKRAESDDFRVVLKLHYCIYPRVLAPLGWAMSWLNTRYNQAFRALFLLTINPKTLYEHFMAWQVNTNTVLFDRIETYLGQRSLVYLAFVGALWWATGCYEAFFALTSFVHYIRYITTFYIRRGIDFGSFKRDVLLFKSIALAQLFYHYLFPSTTTFVLDFVSVAMVVSGYAVSCMATSALGIDRTYFAAELGLVEEKWITQFPYGYIPHPMITSQVCALLGLYKAAHFRKEWPYVVPLHVLLYLVHMLQEEFKVFKSYPEEPVRTAARKAKTA